MTTSRIPMCAVTFLFLFLIICQEVAYVEGRHLKSGSSKKCSSKCKAALNVAKDHAGRPPATIAGGQEKTSKVEYVDEFRPTAPGHSPGVGHSIKT
ncbi:hypothetical protein Tsubulata_044821 [Turnera subulata]|uniref:Uncharacterized protein n=1 Tax=Turnera subulata TaxID=218843 RepID=A0A9Q0JHY5_9ROSI|nr:hypothetical protein Tsubulata_044821 [Turnera subulata]